MKIICQHVVLLFLLCISGYVQSQVIANDENLVTGPSQKIKYDVTKNDVIPCGNYSLHVVSVTPSLSGTAVFDGDYLLFTPFAGVSNQMVDVVYEVSCPSGGSDQATVSIFVRTTNLPINMIQTGEECIDEMPEDVDFGVQTKFIAQPSTGSGRLQPFHIPLVGDLNGDGKPEIISPSTSNPASLNNAIRYIHIFDGQTGNELFVFDLTTLGLGYGSTTYNQTGGGFRTGSLPYHQSPSYFSIADVDGDGIGEIIVAQTCFEGKVYCLKPVLDTNKKITGLSKIWDSDYGHKAPLSPTGASTYEIYGQPIPNIVDINGDGIPEIVIYNKIYNAQTGKLLMAWGGDAVSIPKASALIAGTGLVDYNPGSVSTNETFSSNLKTYAMVGRRPSNTSLYNDLHIAAPAIVDLDGDGIMEIITGSRIHKFNLTYLGRDSEAGDHTQNMYTTIEGPVSVTVNTGTSGSTSTTYYFNDGFTRVADIDGDGELDIIVFQNESGGALTLNVLVYVWDWRTSTVKAVNSFRSNGNHGTFGIPFVGDINDRLDGRDIAGGTFNKKLPEICVIAGDVYIDGRNTTTGILLHPESNMSNSRFTVGYNRIIGLTYDGGETNIQNRLKVSWTLEHQDTSDNTGITMFDFNNDGAFDLCYRDENTLRVISPKLGATDYIQVNETSATSDAIIFNTPVDSETGFEAPAIADVNMDGSADIVVAGYSANGYYANVYVFEYASGNPKWAPCPPVWNQALYNPLHINEDLTVPAKPISMLTKFYNGTDSIQPYNGAWIQQPIVREGGDFVPVYRHPDAVLVNMDVEVSGGNTKIKITIRNDGLASVNAATPIYFYHTVPGSTIKYDETVIPIGVDIFLNEKVELEYTISGSPTGMFTHCCLVHDGTIFPATGYTDCRLDNNEGYTSVIRAIDDDYITVFKNSSDNKINVIVNDTIIGTPIIEIVTGLGEGPKHGMADTLVSRILYTPDPDFLGRDTLRYILRCEYGGDTLATVDTAFVYILVAEMSDNIDEADCVIEAPAMVWGIQETSPMNTTKINNYGLRMIGDIDNDSITEIIAYGPYDPDVYGNKKLEIFYFDESLKSKSSFTFPDGVVTDNRGSAAIARYNDTTYIVVPGRDGYLYAYNVHGAKFWNTTVRYGDNAINATNVGIADFNNDGIPEVYAGNKIYSIVDGSLICDGGTNNKGSYAYGINIYSTLAVDIDGDGKLELIAGTQIYDVNIGTGTMTLKTGWQLPGSELPANVLTEGQSLVVDIDLDGSLDIVIISKNGTYGVTVLVWKPLPDNQSKRIGYYTIAGTANHSTPMIGNIDDTPYPEIIFITSHSPLYMYALRYDESFATGARIVEKWRMSHTDGSGATGATLFDFNQNGVAEIVYRDQTKLRIFDGSGSTPTLRAEFDNVTSPTVREYPIVADIDDDGQAEIIVTGSIPGEIRQEDGYLRIFKASAGTSWAPARKVWNQYVYNSVHVNEDLTIPRYQLNPATVFFGLDGTLGTSDDVRPYNGFLMQQTTLSKFGTPLWLAANGQMTGRHAFDYNTEADSLIITVEISNIGNAAFQPPFHITVYKDNIGNVTKYTFAYEHPILPGETKSIVFGIPYFSQDWLPFNNLYIQLNDNGDGTSEQEVCDDTGRHLKTTNVIASDDRALIFKDDTDREIDILRNDILPAGCMNPVVQILSTPSYSGTASWNGSVMKYTPAPNTYADTLRYRVYCSDATLADTATVYIRIVTKPDNLVDADCYIEPTPQSWEISEIGVANTSLSVFQTPVIGDIDGDGIPEIVVNRANDNGFIIFNGTDLSTPAQNVSLANINYTGTALGLAKIKMDDNSLKTLLFILQNGRLSAYNYQTSSYEWNTTVTYTSGNVAPFGFIDFNGDGFVEIYIGNTLIDAATGNILWKGTGKSGYSPMMNHSSYVTAAGDVLNKGTAQFIIANQVYSVTINRATFTATLLLEKELDLSTFTMEDGAAPFADGNTALLDLDLDGNLDVVVVNSPYTTNGTMQMYVWTPITNQVLAKKSVTGVAKRGIPLMGDVDGDGYPEILFITGYTAADQTNAGDYIRALKYIPGNEILSEMWKLSHTDKSGFTGLTLFDFNQDGKSELVYRDESLLRIINASGKSHITDNDTIVYDLAAIACVSATRAEMPVVADIDGDQQAEIITIGSGTGSFLYVGPLRIFKGPASAPWAPARKVWNQSLYQAVHVNEDLTIPSYPTSPATVFPGADGILGTGDDIRPYNNFLQQQTVLSQNGTPLWLAPDAYTKRELISYTVVGDSIAIHVGIVNLGDAVIASPVYVSLYHTAISDANRFVTDSADCQIYPGDTVYVDVRLADKSLIPSTLEIIVRINDNRGKFTYQDECRDGNNVATILNPGISLLMKKDATLLLEAPNTPVRDNGTYPNPVAVLFSEKIQYAIKALNVFPMTSKVVITDTLPPYLRYETGTADPLGVVSYSQTITSPVRDVLKWTLSSIASGADTTVRFEATPVEGVCASQPMFINRAWIEIDDELKVPTGNNTYHQGAGIGIVTFSAGIGGQIYNAEPQAVDFRSSAGEGVLIVPDEGYVFAGWSYGDYVSLRGETIKAKEHVIYYDTLTIYGNVELNANFELEKYPIEYYLNGGENAGENPSYYTVKTGNILLEAPQKTGDVFMGWTGSNGDEPQMTVRIPGGSTGKMNFYANYLHSGREDEIQDMTGEDKIWATEDRLYVRSSKAGNIVRVYTLEGVLQKQQTILSAGEANIKLQPGIYIVTLNNSAGRKVKIE